jgi:hypothetical protein
MPMQTMPMQTTSPLAMLARRRTQRLVVPTINEGVIQELDEEIKLKKSASTEGDDVKQPESAAVSPEDSAKTVKKIHWNRKVEKKRHHRCQDLSDDELESYWYTESDSKIILAIAKVTVKMMMRGEFCDDVDYCSRGLEGKTPVGSKKRQKNKLRVRKALLEEQEIQREEGVFDPEYLAQVCLKYSREVNIAAHSQGLRDEREIQEYLLVTDGDCSPIQPRRKLR